tara:strand:- start:206 stop:541 length:336 start_codon:yes stop_codon:yes gene_type:complete
MTKDFEYIDGENIPATIKPMVILHDKLVKGYINDRSDINLPKLITKIEDGLKVQVTELVKIEDNAQYVSIRLVETLQGIRKLIDEPCKDYRQGLIELLDSSCNELEKKYKR